MHPDLVGQLTKALSDVERALSKCSDKWSIERRDLCVTWKHILATAPQPELATTAREISVYFHPKAEICIAPELQQEVEALALGLISDRLYRSYEAEITTHIQKRAQREWEAAMGRSDDWRP